MPVHPIFEPCMETWTSFSARLGVSCPVFSFDVDFFDWWKKQLPMIEDFPYVGMDFQGSTNLVLPQGAQWDASGGTLKNMTS
jgi:hypothetical protein